MVYNLISEEDRNILRKNVSISSSNSPKHFIPPPDYFDEDFHGHGIKYHRLKALRRCRLMLPTPPFNESVVPNGFHQFSAQP